MRRKERVGISLASPQGRKPQPHWAPVSLRPSTPVSRFFPSDLMTSSTALHRQSATRLSFETSKLGTELELHQWIGHSSAPLGCKEGPPALCVQQCQVGACHASLIVGIRMQVCLQRSREMHQSAERIARCGRWVAASGGCTIPAPARPSHIHRCQPVHQPREHR